MPIPKELMPQSIPEEQKPDHPKSENIEVGASQEQGSKVTLEQNNIKTQEQENKKTQEQSNKVTKDQNPNSDSIIKQSNNLTIPPKKRINFSWMAKHLFPIFLFVILAATVSIAAVPSWRNSFNKFIAKWSPKADDGSSRGSYCLTCMLGDSCRCKFCPYKPPPIVIQVSKTSLNLGEVAVIKIRMEHNGQWVSPSYVIMRIVPVEYRDYTVDELSNGNFFYNCSSREHLTPGCKFDPLQEISFNDKDQKESFERMEYFMKDGWYINRSQYNQDSHQYELNGTFSNWNFGEYYPDELKQRAKELQYKIQAFIADDRLFHDGNCIDTLCNQCLIAKITNIHESYLDIAVKYCNAIMNSCESTLQYASPVIITINPQPKPQLILKVDTKNPDFDSQKPVSDTNKDVWPLEGDYYKVSPLKKQEDKIPRAKATLILKDNNTDKGVANANVSLSLQYDETEKKLSEEEKTVSIIDKNDNKITTITTDSEGKAEFYLKSSNAAKVKVKAEYKSSAGTFENDYTKEKGIEFTSQEASVEITKVCATTDTTAWDQIAADIGMAKAEPAKESWLSKLVNKTKNKVLSILGLGDKAHSEDTSGQICNDLELRN